MDHQGSENLGPVDRLIVVGASARALAESATAAGREVYAADLFNDADLRAVAAQSIRISFQHYPSSLLAAVRTFPKAPWAYTGAMENHPACIDDLAAANLLAGNAGAVVRAIRDPFLLGAKARTAGFLFPKTRLFPTGLPRDGTWLIKPLASASGRAVYPWMLTTPHPRQEGMIWQQRVTGHPHAASFIITSQDVHLLGLSRQLIGEPWSFSGPYAYGGSITLPAVETPSRLAATALAIGRMLAEQFHLIGAVGVDLIVDGKGRPWIIEVNPRVTASMELHERSTGVSLAAAHLEACGIPHHNAARILSGGDGKVWAKAVLHTSALLPVTIEQVASWQATALSWTEADGGRSAIADIPSAGQTLPPRAPVLTVFANGASTQAALAALRRRAATLAASWPRAVSQPSAAASPPPPHATSTA
jgi:predicted ATP-grasp superfamily ATP-dependent carboligase